MRELSRLDKTAKRDGGLSPASKTSSSTLPGVLSIHKRIRSIEQLKSKAIVDARFPIRRDSFVHTEEFNQRQVSVKQYLQQCKELKKQLKHWQDA